MSADFLHYYCSSSTFLKLIKGRKLWLTDLTASNDSAEGIWARDSVLKKFRFEQKFDIQKHEGAKLGISSAMREHVALGMCLSGKDDLLSQWRGYADQGRGVCLSFRRESLFELVEFCGDKYPRLRLQEINYDEAYLLGGRPSRELTDLVNAAFSSWINNFEMDAGGFGGSASIAYDPKKREAETEAVTALYCSKNSAFGEENEWRLMMVERPRKIADLGFREHDGWLSPKVEIDFNPSLIHSIRLGPKNPSRREKVEELLDRLGAGQAAVYRSNATLR